MSYRKGVNHLNRLLHREEFGDLFKLKTLSDRSVIMGDSIVEAKQRESDKILCSNGINSETIDLALSPQESNPVLPLYHPDRMSRRISKRLFREQIDRFNEGKSEECQIKDSLLIMKIESNPDEMVYICIDEVGVPYQKEERSDKTNYNKKRKYVENTVIYIHSSLGSYTITNTKMKEAFKQLSAYLIINHLTGKDRQVLFFSDGARNVKHYIEAFFGKMPIILDWYHLELRMTQLLSMALKHKKEERKHIFDELRPILWAGNFKDAIKYLKQLDASKVKSWKHLGDAVDYLSRKSEYRACYALRKELGYINSSNRVEKANDLIVAQRQKNRGMSWSFTGSGALAAIICEKRNGGLESWIKTGNFSFSHHSTVTAI